MKGQTLNVFNSYSLGTVAEIKQAKDKTHLNVFLPQEKKLTESYDTWKIVEALKHDRRVSHERGLEIKAQHLAMMQKR